MKVLYKRNTLVVMLFFMTQLISAQVEGKDMEGYFLLDDFNSNLSVLNNPWEGFTDRVMGGISDILVTKKEDSDGKYIEMSGKVSVENNGGFIQVRQTLSSFLGVFDGSPYKGIKLRVRGIDSGYYIFLRTSSTIFPWQYYSAPIKLTEEWSDVYIPWSDFKKGDYGTLGKLKINKLKSLAIVAYGKEFNAKIEVHEIGFYE